MLAPAIMGAAAQRVFVLNLVTQDAETFDMSGAEHLEALAKHVGVTGPGILVAHDGQLAVPGATSVTVDTEDAARHGWRVVFADVADETADWPEHDPLKLGSAGETGRHRGLRPMPHYLTLDDVEVDGLTVLVRSDLNVPIEDGVITDDFRIRAALPTLERLVDSGARERLLASRASGRLRSGSRCVRWPKPWPPCPRRKWGLLEGVKSPFWRTRGSIRGKPTTILRWLPGSPMVPTSSCRTPSDLCIGLMLRQSASPIWSNRSWPLLDAELTALSRFLGDPPIPYVVVLGGAKVTDKLGVIENLLPRVDAMLIGGGMCFTLLKAKGVEVGTRWSRKKWWTRCEGS